MMKRKLRKRNIRKNILWG